MDIDLPVRPLVNGVGGPAAKAEDPGPPAVSMVKYMGAASCGSVQVKAERLARGITYRMPSLGWQRSTRERAAMKPAGSLG